MIGAASSRAPRSLRLIRRLIAFAGRRILRLKLELVGAENLPRAADGRPAGGWIAAGLPHVTWIEPFVMLVLLPPEPRLIWFGDGRVIERSRWRRFVSGRLGGIEPIWPGGGAKAFAAHVAAVEGVIDAGAIFAMFPEAGPAVPPGFARPVQPGIGYFALRSRASIVPIVFGGTHELFLGRQIQMRVLPAASWHRLAGVAPDTAPPDPGSPAERDLATAIAAGLAALTAAEVARAHASTEPAPGTRKRALWLTHAFR
ncbi:MAG: lysophospholipid acyltransferase family protein [Candidatus Limnocylindrales bacterium]